MRTKILHSILKTSAFVMGCGLAAAFTLPQVGCSSAGPAGGSSAGSGTPGATAPGQTGELGLKLTFPGGETINSITYTITGNGFTVSKSVPVQNSTSINFVVGGIPAGNGYSITISGTSVDGTVTCSGSATFSVVAQTTTTVTDALQCKATAPDAGAVSVNAPAYGCASIFPGGISASPSETTIGGSVSLQAAAVAPNANALAYTWSAPSGTFSTANSSTTNFTCTTQGPVTVTATVSDGAVPDGAPACTAVSTSIVVTCDTLIPNSLIISSSTYSSSTGAVASLAVGTPLANTATATVAAVSGNDYVHVWNNSSVDSSFGVTSPIQLTVLNPTSSQVLNTISVPSNQVVTSFSSKSELGLHFVSDPNGGHLVFVAYAGAGVGAIDVSNSDAVPGQDLTNPVTFAFGSNYAFARTIVSMDPHGTFAYTPTIAYGGNNGRSGTLGSNGLYYTVGNANNGNAAAFGSSNGTNPDVTETTGLEVVTPINAATSTVAIPSGNSAEVDPLIQYNFTDGGKADKPGKDDNYRGLTEYGGALYFTKGSGSNGMDTVYTVPSLPTVANAASQTISVVPGFPTDSAKATGGDYTPFAVFFANPTTMYVTDEGTGDATDVSTHAGLEKWSLVGGTWQLDYVLTSGLIGTVDTSPGGADAGPGGPWPNVTTVGLRNLTGVVNTAAGTVTLWATTSTSSTSGDNGADPNKVVTITDQIGATTASAVAGESFSVVVGPTYGTVYRGVAFVTTN
jgi:hypothetical protein